MLRILADVTEDQLQALEFLAQQQAVSRAEVIRRAIAAYVTENGPPVSSFFGAWRTGEREPEDGLAFQDRMRGEW